MIQSFNDATEHVEVGGILSQWDNNDNTVYM